MLHAQRHAGCCMHKPDKAYGYSCSPCSACICGCRLVNPRACYAVSRGTVLAEDAVGLVTGPFPGYSATAAWDQSTGCRLPQLLSCDLQAPAVGMA
jgi:hypothetical protein